MMMMMNKYINTMEEFINNYFDLRAKMKLFFCEE